MKRFIFIISAILICTNVMASLNIVPVSALSSSVNIPIAEGAYVNAVGEPLPEISADRGDITFGTYDPDRLIAFTGSGVGATYISYIKFDLTDLNVAECISVTLNMEYTEDGADVEVYALEDNSWSADTVTWNNQPIQASTPIHVPVAENCEKISSFFADNPTADLTQYFLANPDKKVFSFVLTTGFDGAILSKNASLTVKYDTPINATSKATRINGKIVLAVSTDTDIPDDSLIHVALYDGKDMLVDYILVPILKDDEEFKRFYVVLEDEESVAAYAKMFIWEQDMMPRIVANKVEIYDF